VYQFLESATLVIGACVIPAAIGAVLMFLVGF
jgi:hypothetical protein